MRYSTNKAKLLGLFVIIMLITPATLAYDYTEGERWLHSDFPVYYYINTTNAPAGAVATIQAAFNTWENASNGRINFEYAGNTSAVAYNEDDTNCISFGTIDDDTPAACSLMVDDSDGYIVEVDLKFDITDHTWGSFPNWNLLNVATHEVGHWLSLNDLDNYPQDTEKTMYHTISFPWETKKASLHSDDIAGMHYIYSKIKVPLDFSTIVDAASHATSGQTIEVAASVSSSSGTGTILSGVTLSINSDITVSSGALTFASGSNLELNGHTISEDGGSINWNGRPAGGDIILWDNNSALRPYSTILSAISAASSGDDVYLGDGQYGYVYMKSGVDVHGTGSDYYQSRFSSVTFDSTSVSYLRDVRVTGGIEMDNCSGICAVVNTVVVNGAGGGIGIDINQSFSVVLEEVSISGIYKGVYSHGTSYPSIYDGGYEDMELYALHMAGPGTMSVGGTWFCDNDIYDIKETSTATVYASYCIWSGNPNYTTWGNVYYYPEPPYHDECGFYRQLATESPLVTLPADEVDADGEAYREAYEIFVAARQRLMGDWRAGKEPNPRDYAEELTEAIELFKMLAAECAGPSSVRALGAVAACYGLLEDNEAAYKYLTYVANTDQYASLKPYAQSLLVSHYRLVGDSETALALADAILAGATDDHLVGETLYTKGLIYQKDLGDSTMAAEMFAAMARDYPEHPTTFLAVNRLEEMGEEVPESIPATPEEEVEPEVAELSLSGYPNPFNPTATVRFGLPEAGNVTLIVYDLMGREVVRLAEGYREAGWQQVVWDGRDASGREVPTGMYLARLVTPQGVKAIKLVMMK